MKVVVSGTRGIPDILGGVETHCQELYPRLVELGHEIILCRRSCYIQGKEQIKEYKGVWLKDIYAPKQKSVEAIFHSFLAVLYAKKVHADILHIHAIGPALVAPFARLLGLKVVMTHHGADYERQKWGKMAKAILKAGERMGAMYANRMIVISTIIQNNIKQLYKKESTLIYNGVNVPQKSINTDYIKELGLTPGKYIFMMGRFVEEKGFHDAIDAFSSIQSNGYTMVLAGDADHETSYSLSLKQKCKENYVITTGFIKGEKLNQLLTNARLFLLPSYHEGLPIALLEAMSYDLDVLVSDIPANLQVKLSLNSYFSCGNIDELSVKLKESLTKEKHKVEYSLQEYNWDYIAMQTNQLYFELK